MATVSIDVTFDAATIDPSGEALADGYALSSGGELLYYGSADSVAFTDGIWVVYYVVDEGSNYLPGTNSSYAYIYGGTNSNDIIVGSYGSDWIEGFGGRDYLIGLGGDDNLWGNEGDDVLIGGLGDDNLYGGTGRDNLQGGEGDDYIWADGLDADFLVDGGTGNDYIQVSAMGSAASGGSGNDTISFDGYADIGNTTLDGGDGTDSITAYLGEETTGQLTIENAEVVRLYLFSDEVAVSIQSNSSVTLQLGWATYSSADPTVVVSASSFDVGPDVVSIDMTNWSIASADTFTLHSNDLDNWIFGSANNEVIFADGGNDYINTNIMWAGGGLGYSQYGETHGGSGNDTIVGGYGDQLYGDQGSDVIRGNGSTIYGGADKDVFEFYYGENIIVDFERGETLVNRLITGNVQLEPSELNPDDFWDAQQFTEGVRVTSGDFSFFLSGTVLVEDLTGSFEWVSASGGYLPQLIITTVNSRPSIETPIADQTATEEQFFSFIIPVDAFQDVDVGDVLTYSATLADGAALPSWLTFDASTRTFSGTPQNNDVGILAVSVTASDSANATVTDEFKITIVNENDTPTLESPIADQTATEDAPFSFQFAATAFADVDVGDVLTYSATLADGAALPSWLTFDASTRTFSGTPQNNDVGILAVSVTASDSANATVTDEFKITIVNENDTPTLESPIADQTATEDAPFSFQFAATAFADVDVGDVLTYSATLADGAALPSWLTFDASTRTFSGTPQNNDVGILAVSVTASDSANATVTDEFKITIVNENDTPTLESPIADQTATEDAPFSFQFAATAFADVDVGDVLTYSATLADGAALPSWLTFDASTRTFSGTPQYDDIGAVAIRVSATDSTNASIFDDFIIVTAALRSLIEGTARSEILRGTASADLILGLGGKDKLYGLDGNDRLEGGSGNDDLQGGNGNDVLVGGTGDDKLTGGNGTDTASYDGTFADVSVSLALSKTQNTGGAGKDTLVGIENLNGGAGNDTLIGEATANRIEGRAGNDVLNGGLGNDTLLGGTGNDIFIFNSVLGAANVDTLDSFNVADDSIHLENTGIFSALTTTGVLVAGVFNTGPEATEADDRIIYDIVTSALIYDADGVGGAAGIQFATLTDTVGTLTADDFVVI